MDVVPINRDTVVVATSEQVSCTLDKEAVVLCMKNGAYYGMKDVASDIWTLLQQPVTIAKIAEKLTAEYDVNAAECERDLTRLMEELIGEGLVEVRDAKGAQIS